MKIVKADAKGRATGLDAGGTYKKVTYPDGTIRYEPQSPRTYDRVKDVTPEEFEAFFGVSIKEVAEDGIRPVPVTSENEFCNTGIALEVFELDASGERLRDPGTNRAARSQVLVRVKRR